MFLLPSCPPLHVSRRAKSPRSRNCRGRRPSPKCCQVGHTRSDEHPSRSAKIPRRCFSKPKNHLNAAVIADMVGDYLRLPCQSQSTVIKRLRHQRGIAQEEKIADVRVFRKGVDWREPGLQQGRAALFSAGINRSDIDGAGLVDAASMIDEMSAVGKLALEWLSGRDGLGAVRCTGVPPPAEIRNKPS